MKISDHPLYPKHLQGTTKPNGGGGIKWTGDPTTFILEHRLLNSSGVAWNMLGNA